MGTWAAVFRKLTSEQEEKIKSLLTSGCPSRYIRTFCYDEFKKNLTTYDVTNLRKKFNDGRNNPVYLETIIRQLASEGYVERLLRDDNYLRILAFCSD